MPRCCERLGSYLESGYLVSVARLLVYMWPPTSMCTGALDFVSWAGSGIPWAARGDTGDRVRDNRDMLPPSWRWKKAHDKGFSTTELGTPLIANVITDLIRSLLLVPDHIFA